MREFLMLTYLKLVPTVGVEPTESLTFEESRFAKLRTWAL